MKSSVLTEGLAVADVREHASDRLQRHPHHTTRREAKPAQPLLVLAWKEVRKYYSVLAFVHVESVSGFENCATIIGYSWVEKASAAALSCGTNT